MIKTFTKQITLILPLLALLGGKNVRAHEQVVIITKSKQTGIFIFTRKALNNK